MWLHLATSCFGIKEGGSPIILLHGLFGSARNWQSVAKHLSHSRTVWTLDLRNHGTSPWACAMTYAAMAEDVIHFIEQLGQGSVSLVGHSMGGKIAMFIALTRPSLVSRLLVLDTAPVPYDHDQTYLHHSIEVMQQLPLEKLNKRSDADQFLAPAIPESAVRAFFLQNLIKTHQPTQWRWRLNLKAIGSALSEVTGFPELESDTVYPGPTLFLRGETSTYVLPHHFPIIDKLFPQCHHDVIEGAGHWLHVQQPQVLIDKIGLFMTQDP